MGRKSKKKKHSKPKKKDQSKSKSKGAGKKQKKEKALKQTTDGLTIVGFNVNSLHPVTKELREERLGQLREMVEEEHIDILVIGESKLDKKVSDGDVHIDGFEIVRHDRNRHGGGVAVYLRSARVKWENPIKYTGDDGIELVVVHVTKPINFSLLAIYRSPRKLYHGFTAMVREVFDLDYPTLLVGDINIDPEKKDASAKALNKCLLKKVRLLITEPTNHTKTFPNKKKKNKGEDQQKEKKGKNQEEEKNGEEKREKEKEEKEKEEEKQEEEEEEKEEEKEEEDEKEKKEKDEEKEEEATHSSIDHFITNFSQNEIRVQVLLKPKFQEVNYHNPILCKIKPPALTLPCRERQCQKRFLDEWSRTKHENESHKICVMCSGVVYQEEGDLENHIKNHGCIPNKIPSTYTKQ